MSRVLFVALLLAPPAAAANPATAVGLDALTQQALAQHPKLAQAAFAVDAARGKALQAGLYPNPTISFTFDELGDRQGPRGVNTLPLVTQEFVRGGKLVLSRAAAGREVDRAALELTARRYALLGEVRTAYFDVVAVQRRIEILADLVQLADKSVEQTDKLLKANQVSRLTVIQLEVERERLAADWEAGRRELPAAFRQLAAVVGAPHLTVATSADALDLPLPPYDLDAAQRIVLANHPDKHAAAVGVEAARLRLRREQVEPVPNVTVGAGYVRQNQNKSNDWTIGASVPLPLWNRNKGNIAAAAAQLLIAEHDVRRVEVELAGRVAAAVRDFAAARARAERYRTGILPKAAEAYELSLKAYRGGEFEYLRVLEAQRAAAQARLDHARALGEAWKAAATLSGLALEDQWPPPTKP